MPEGSVVEIGNVLVSVVNTDPRCAWLTTYIETILLKIWYPITVATNSLHSRMIIKHYMQLTCNNLDKLPFMLNDFGYRGVSSEESAEIGGFAHLSTGFMGTDNIAGIMLAEEFYNQEEMPAFSVAAAEHSTVTSWGKENESKAYKNMLDKFAKPGAIVAVVSDSYDIENAVKYIWGEELKDDVINSGATVVIRPDSGHPPIMVAKILKLLDEKFGSTVNSKGFKVLHPSVRVIQGDGITTETILEILQTMMDSGYSADNIVFGQGGALLQQVNRDTMSFAMKASAALIDGTWVDVYKDPVTDPGKRSKKGRLYLHKDNNGVFYTDNNPDNCVLETVFRNGKILKEYSLQEIRDRGNSY